MVPAGAPGAVARPASTVLALRPTRPGFTVLMVRRAARSSFMGNARVFPGGALEDVDASALAASVVSWSGAPDELPWRSAALRELIEEAGLLVGDGRIDTTKEGVELYRALADEKLRLDADRLHHLSTWVTPEGLPKRFDTRFYVTVVAPAAAAVADEREVHDPVWVTPADALSRADAGDWQVELPTRWHLEWLAPFDEPDEAVRAAADATPRPVHPRLDRSAEGAVRILLPGDPGYAEARL